MKSHEDFNLPTMEKAYVEACHAAHPQGNKNFSHKVVEHAFMETGSYDLRTMPKHVTLPIFERNYDIACRLFMNGDNLRTIPKAIEEIKDKTITKEIGRNALHNIRAILTCAPIK